MNAIAAIGGPALFRVVDGYRALVPSEVWVLGIKPARDPKDPLLRSLEALLEPFMDEYFAGEARVRLAALSTQFAQHPLTAGELEPAQVGEAVSTVLERGLPSALALVEMLDRAHGLAPIELVVTDDSSVLAQTAVAWARARGLPAATVPGGTPLQRPQISDADRTIVVGERARCAYGAAGIEGPRLVALAAPDAQLRAISPDMRAERRTDAKAAFTRVLGWAPADIVVVFDPAGRARDSAHAWATAFRASLSAMFAAFAVARGSVPALRLAVVTQPTPDGLAWAGPAAVAAGIAASDFAYAQADHELWLDGADIIVSADSTRSIEAAGVGVPAVNLPGAGSRYDGAAFAAEDGVIDASAPALSAMIAALAGDAGIRAQIAGIAGERIAGESPASAAAIAAIAGELVKLRRPPPMSARKPKPDIVIWAPGYDHASGGIRALHRLCHLINLAGGNAWLHEANKFHPTWNTPRRDFPFTDETIVLVPEIVFAHPSVKRIVRWVLNKPGLLGGPTTYGPNEMVFYYAKAFREAAQAATQEVLTDERELEVFTVDPEQFYNDRSRPRLYDCTYIGKGEALYGRVQPREIRDALVIARGATVWPANRSETAALLRGCRRLYSFDAHTAIVQEAIICGARAFYVRDNGELEEYVGTMARHIFHYYDLSRVERFLALVSERRWE